MLSLFESMFSGHTLRDYGIGFTEYMMLVAVPLVLFLVLDLWTKLRR